MKCYINHLHHYLVPWKIKVSNLLRQGSMVKTRIDKKGKTVSNSRKDGFYRSKNCSLFVPFISIVDVILFILTMYVNNCPQHSDNCVLEFLRRFSFQPLRENPLLGPSSSVLLKMGGLSSVSVAHGHQFWRVFTCIWLHAGLIHLFVNILSLLFIGIRLEQEFGCEKIGSIFFLSGIGGSLFAEMFLERRVAAGASTPLFGLLGAMLSDLIINWSIYEMKCPSLAIFALLSAGNFAIGIFPYNDSISHIGGFIFGLLLGFVLLMRPQHDWGNNIIQRGIEPQRVSKYRAYQIFLWVAALLLLVIGYFMDIFLVVRGVSANCSWCHYFSCVPSSWWTCDDDGGHGGGRAICNYVISGNYMYMRCESNLRTQLYNGIFSGSTLKLLCSKLCS